MVTYYRIMKGGDSNIRTNIVDSAATRAVINMEYKKIVNLEITLTKPLTFTADDSDGSVDVTGEAYMYSGMNAYIGDNFLYGTGDGRIGLFRISNVSPSSWRDDSNYIVSFALQSFADESDIAPLEAATKETLIFDKENYLGGANALLQSEDYINLQKIRALRTNLIKFYHQKFYDKNKNSYFRPDGIYDVCAVQFMGNKMSLDLVKLLPKNLMGKDPDVYSQSLWSRFDERYNPTLYGVSPYYCLTIFSPTRMAINVTELARRTVLLPSDTTVIEDSPTYYIFSGAFWTGDTTTMSPLELLVYTAITQRTVGKLSDLITLYLQPAFMLSPMDQYNLIPIYIHLIDMSFEIKQRQINAPSMDYAYDGS